MTDTDPRLGAFADHFAYRQQRYEAVRSSIESSEGSLEDFSLVSSAGSASVENLGLQWLNLIARLHCLVQKCCELGSP